MNSGARAGELEGFRLSGFLHILLFSLLVFRLSFSVPEEFPFGRAEGDAAVVAGGGAFGGSSISTGG